MSSIFSWNSSPKGSIAPPVSAETTNSVNSRTASRATSFFGSLFSSQSPTTCALNSVSKSQPVDVTYDNLPKMFSSQDMPKEAVIEELKKLKQVRFITPSDTNEDLFTKCTTYMGSDLMAQLDVDIRRMTGTEKLYLNGEKLPTSSAVEFIKKLKETAPHLTEEELNTLFATIQQGGIQATCCVPLQEKLNGNVRFKGKSSPDYKMSLNIKTEVDQDGKVKKSNFNVVCMIPFLMQLSSDGEADLETEVLASFTVDLEHKTAAGYWEFLENIPMNKQLSGKTNKELQSTLRSLNNKSFFPKFMDGKFFSLCSTFKPGPDDTLESQIDADMSRDTGSGLIKVNGEKISPMNGEQFIELIKQKWGDENPKPVLTLLQQGGARFATLQTLMDELGVENVMLTTFMGAEFNHDAIYIQADEKAVNLKFIQSFKLLSSSDSIDLGMRIISSTSINLAKEKATLEYEICDENEFLSKNVSE